MSFKVGLALGGGGVRGFAHVGVLRVLEKEGISADIISGTSFGSIVGATYCIDGNLDNCERKLLDAVHDKRVAELEKLIGATSVEDKRVVVERLANFVKDLCLWNLKVLRRWLVDPRPYRELIYKLVGSNTFEDLKVPFVSVAADLNSGEEIAMKNGDLFPAVMASISIAGIFPPFKVDGRTLIDGGALSIVPMDAARAMGANYVIGINVEGNLLFGDIHNGLDALFQAYEISSYQLNRVKLKTCDFVVDPPLRKIKWAQFSKSEECIKVGEETAAKIIDDLKKSINYARKKRVMFSFLGINKFNKAV